MVIMQSCSEYKNHSEYKIFVLLLLKLFMTLETSRTTTILGQYIRGN